MTAPVMPVEMPEMRRHLMAKWSTERMWRTVEGAAAKNYYPPGMLRERAIDAGVAMQTTLLENADLYWVGEEMCDLLFGTTHSVPGDVLGSELTFPSKYGLLVFARTWDALDTSDPVNTVCHVDAIAWVRDFTTVLGEEYEGRIVETLTVSCYRCIDWSNSAVQSELKLALQLNAAEDAKRSTIIGPDGKLAAVLTGTSWMPLGRSTWPLEESVDHPIRTVGEKTVEIHMTFEKPLPDETHIRTMNEIVDLDLPIDGNPMTITPRSGRPDPTGLRFGESNERVTRARRRPSRWSTSDVRRTPRPARARNTAATTRTVGS